jgi:hypothetical protein
MNTTQRLLQSVQRGARRQLLGPAAAAAAAKDGNTPPRVDNAAALAA